MSIDGIRDAIGADTLGYLGTEDLENLAPNSKLSFCRGCFTGKYPIEVPKEIKKNKFETKLPQK